MKLRSNRSGLLFFAPILKQAHCLFREIFCVINALLRVKNNSRLIVDKYFYNGKQNTIMNKVRSL